MDINDVRALVTVAAFVCFVAIVLWAYSGKRKQRFEQAARLPFTDEEADGGAAPGPGQQKGAS
jgi:cytochrome c oxidase cbb3-type subunit 4